MEDDTAQEYHNEALLEEQAQELKDKVEKTLALIAKAWDTSLEIKE